MKQLFTILTLTVFPLLFKAGNIDLVQLRDLYYKASTNKADAEKFFEATQNASGISKTLVTGYSGMSYMIKANYAFNPYNKLSYFFKGKSLLDGAIKTDPKNAELRFLRYCVQTNAPSFLAYKDNIKEDKQVLLAAYDQLTDSDLKQRIKNFMKNSGYCPNGEKLVFK